MGSIIDIIDQPFLQLGCGKPIALNCLPIIFGYIVEVVVLVGYS